jgi:hypothetical protein
MYIISQNRTAYLKGKYIHDVFYICSWYEGAVTQKHGMALVTNKNTIHKQIKEYSGAKHYAFLCGIFTIKQLFCEFTIRSEGNKLQ